MTRYDRDFLPQITVVVTFVIRSLAVRLQAVDAPSVLLSTLPLLLRQHYADFRQSRSKLGSAYAQGGAYSLSTLFQASQAHIGLDAEGKIEPEYVRQTFELVLGGTLPAEDCGSESERIIIREVLTKVVVKDVAPLLAQPWFWHKIMLEQLEKFGGTPRVRIHVTLNSSHCLTLFRRKPRNAQRTHPPRTCRSMPLQLPCSHSSKPSPLSASRLCRHTRKQRKESES